MSGHVRQRGKKGQWYAVIDVLAGGKRKRRWHRLDGCDGKREAEKECARLIAKQVEGNYIEPSKATVADFVRARISQWEASGEISARTAQRYRQLLENQIAPHIGDRVLAKLKPLDIEAWHNALRPLAARTIGHAHRVLSKALKDAAKNDIVSRNVCTQQPAPKVKDDEKAIVRDVPALLAKLPSWRHTPIAAVALFTGMRLGEVLALRWSNVDLDHKVIRVREALEQTLQFGIRFKAPKSKAGRRDITLPDILIDALREHRKAQLELRLQLGAGKLPDDALLFADLGGQPWAPNLISMLWGNFARSIGIPEVTFHGLRHTHASQLIDQGVDIATISKRLGHATPAITLSVYAHRFQRDDRKAAAAINAMKW